MSIANAFDITLQFNQQVMQDVQVRVLNTSVDTNLWIKGPFSRIIEQRVPSLEVKACWNKPSIEICDDDEKDLIEVSAEVNGGARQIVTGRILTIDGEVSTKLPVILDTDANGRPYACLESPKPHRLHMGKLKVTYEGSKWPEFLSRIDPAKEETSLRPTLTRELMKPLASISLTYMPYSLPVTMPMQSEARNEALPIVQAEAKLVPASKSVMLGLMLNQTRSAPSAFSTLLADETKYNAALGISTEGLNTLLSYLCKQRRAAGKLIHSQWGLIDWQWENLSVTLRQHMVQIAGVLWQRGVRTVVHADVQCTLDINGCLQNRLLSTNTDIPTAETILVSWSLVLKALLHSRATGKQNHHQHDWEQLYQCFCLPGTSEVVEAAAQELVVEDGMLAVYYSIPKTIKGLQVEIPPAKPGVIISQPVIPQQTAQGAPVTAHMEATITQESSPPYDYIWTTDLSTEPRPEHGSKMTISKVPHQLTVGPGSQKLADVHLKVIDMFGQVTDDVQGSAQYLPYSKLEQNTRSDTRPLHSSIPPSNRKKEKSLKSSIFIGGSMLAILVVLLTVYYALATKYSSVPSNPVRHVSPISTIQPSPTPTASTLVSPTPTIQLSPTPTASTPISPTPTIQLSPTPTASTPISPTIWRIRPASGPTVGGTSVIIRGTDLIQATSVSFGETKVTHFTIDSDTQITATSPAGTGTVYVTVTTPAGTSATSDADKFSYVPPTQVSPTQVSPIQ